MKQTPAPARDLGRRSLLGATLALCAGWLGAAVPASARDRNDDYRRPEGLELSPMDRYQGDSGSRDRDRRRNDIPRGSGELDDGRGYRASKDQDRRDRDRARHDRDRDRYDRDRRDRDRRDRDRIQRELDRRDR